MATIFDKGVSGDKCLILNPREALFYNFDFGTGWREVRMGMSYSLTNSTGDNGQYGNETISNTSLNPTNLIFFGLTKAETDQLPFYNTGIFIGALSNTGNNISLSNGSITNNSRYGLISGNQITGSVNDWFASYFSPSSTVNASGTGGYASIYGVKVEINREAKTFSVRSANMSQNNGDTSTVFLRQQINSFQGTIPGSDSTGYYTETFTSVGNFLPYPNKMLIYFPFFNNRLRIHNLVIEKYQ